MEQEKKMEEIQEREQKINEIKEQKIQLVREREKAQIKIIQQKEDMLKRLNKIQKQNKEIDPETIKNIFPDDQSLFNEVVKLKEWQKEEEKRRKLDDYENESVQINVNYSNNLRYKNYSERNISDKRKEENENDTDGSGVDDEEETEEKESIKRKIHI